MADHPYVVQGFARGRHAESIPRVLIWTGDDRLVVVCDAGVVRFSGL
ncbi:hypothetical protein ACQPW3_04305 [Actinosynnema sp. CA-248983]